MNLRPFFLFFLQATSFEIHIYLGNPKIDSRLIQFPCETIFHFPSGRFRRCWILMRKLTREYARTEEEVPRRSQGRTRQFRWETKLRRYRNGLRSLIKLIQRARHKISRATVLRGWNPRIAACRRFVGRATYNFAPMFNSLAVNS